MKMVFLLICLFIVSTQSSFAEECVIAACSLTECIKKSDFDNKRAALCECCETTHESICLHKFSKCEQQEDGKCGWTQNDELKKCLEK